MSIPTARTNDSRTEAGKGRALVGFAVNAVLFAAWALACWTASAVAQAYTPPPPPLTTAPCVPTKKTPCPTSAPKPTDETKSAFDFPGEGDAKTLPPVETIGGSAHTEAGAPATKKDSTDRSDKFAFPGSGASSSSSSSSNSSSSAADGDDASTGASDRPSASAGKRTAAGSGRRKLEKPEDLAGREAEDLDIAHYYLTTGAFAGSYNRAKDALRLAPNDPEAHFAVAAAARGLKKEDEALAEFKAYLDLAPEGDHRKAAQKALAAARK